LLLLLQDTLDETLPDTLHMTGIYLMILLTSLAIVTVSIYYYAIMTGALFLAFAMMQYLYLPAATLLKRWAGDTASTLFVHVDESLQGMDVIRAFDAVNYFIQVRIRPASKNSTQEEGCTELSFIIYSSKAAGLARRWCAVRKVQQDKRGRSSAALSCPRFAEFPSNQLSQQGQ
jgi:hypothetical protein